MQQALYNTIRTRNSTQNTHLTLTTAPAPVPTARRSGLARWAAGRWEIIGVLALMASSAVYGVSALAHLGF